MMCVFLFIWSTLCLSCSHNKDTGIFTVSPGRAGLYYFSTYHLIDLSEFADFDITADGQRVCRAAGGYYNTALNDHGPASCSGLAQLEEGERERVRERQRQRERGKDK